MQLSLICSEDFMRDIPRVREIDSTLSLVREGYRFISNRCEQLQTDVFETRILFGKTICFRGEEAAKVFYDNDKFFRKRAMPKLLQKTLIGEGGVQVLDGDIHRRRKQIFMGLMTPEHIDQLTALTRQQWQAAAQQWEERGDRIILLDAANEVLCRAVCAWSGVPLPESDVKKRTQELATIIEGSGRASPKHFQSRLARKQAEQWVGNLLEKIRAGELEVPENSAAHTFALYRNPDGSFLDRHTAAVELLNVLRPVVAIGRYIVFAALALHEHPECRQPLKEDASYRTRFTQEVRRFYPFFPFTSARTCRAFEWQDYHFPEGVQVFLDLYGTNHDPQVWENPHEFRPDRFRDWNGSPFNFIPQGGGDFATNHRCAGEWITIRLMEMTLDFLVNSIAYDVPEQDLTVSLTRMPTAPASGFMITNVRRI